MTNQCKVCKVVSLDHDVDLDSWYEFFSGGHAELLCNPCGKRVKAFMDDLKCAYASPTDGVDEIDLLCEDE